MTPLEWGMLVALSVLWGGSFFFNGVAVRELPTFTVVVCRVPMPSPEAVAALAAIAVLSTALAYILYFRILATAGATNLLLVTFLIPVSAILLGVMVLGEVLLVRHIGGMALIGLGLAAIDRRPWRALRRRPAA